MERSPRIYTYHTIECIRSGNDLSSCELFICKVATVKHHIISALFQHSPANAEVTASEQIPEKSRTEGSQVHFKTWCFEKSPCLSQSTSETGLNYDTGYKFFEMKWFCHKYLLGQLTSGFEGVLVHRNITVNQFWETGSYYRTNQQEQ